MIIETKHDRATKLVPKSKYSTKFDEIHSEEEKPTREGAQNSVRQTQPQLLCCSLEFKM